MSGELSATTRPGAGKKTGRRTAWAPIVARTVLEEDAGGGAPQKAARWRAEPLDAVNYLCK